MTLNHTAGAVLFTINLKSIANFYGRVVGMSVMQAEDDHIRLEAGGFNLVVHLIPEQHAKGITIATPPIIREDSAIKLAFQVDDIARARKVASELGGLVYPPEREWNYQGSTVCDGYDPDGNVFQLFMK